MKKHTIQLVTKANDTYCGECGRNVSPRGHGDKVVGTWPLGQVDGFGIHKVTGRAALAARGF